MLTARGLRLGQQLDRGHYDKVRGEVLEKMKGTKSNVEFLMQIQKTTSGPDDSK